MWFQAYRLASVSFLLLTLASGSSNAKETEIFIDMTPTGQRVEIGGKVVGVAPVFVKLGPGEHIVRVGEGESGAEARLYLPHGDFQSVLLRAGDVVVVGDPASVPKLAPVVNLPDDPAEPTATLFPEDEIPRAGILEAELPKAGTGAGVSALPASAAPVSPPPKLVETEGKNISEIFAEAESLHASDKPVLAPARVATEDKPTIGASRKAQPALSDRFRTPPLQVETEGKSITEIMEQAEVIHSPAGSAESAPLPAVAERSNAAAASDTTENPLALEAPNRLLDPPEALAAGPKQVPAAALTPAPRMKRSGAALAIASVATAVALASGGVMYAYARHDLDFDTVPGRGRRQVNATYPEAQIANGAAIASQSAAGIALASFIWYLASSKPVAPVAVEQ